MKLLLVPVSRTLLIAASIFLLTGCSAIDQIIHPGEKAAKPAEPASETVQKEGPAPQVKPETPAVAPVERPQPPPPPPPPPPAPPKTQKPAPAPVLQVAEVVWSAVNLREGPGTNYKVSGSARKGNSVSVLEDKGQWLRVRLEDGKEAWVFKAATSLAPKTTPAASPPAKPKPM